MMRSSLTLAALVFVMSGSASAQQSRWPPNSMDRPRPPVVDPGPERPPVPPPSDAIVLFDGRSLARWQTDSGAPARWAVRDGFMEVVPGTGAIQTKQSFGSVQLHVEWAAPLPAEGESQERGNSGVFLMSTYEVQVLDSYGNQTYPDGQAGAIYGQYPPLVNASLPPGEWQSYDIVFHRPHFDGTRVVQPARFTVFHNGVLIQDDVQLVGPTSHGRRDPYSAHADRLPLALQDHGNRVRYRNIWIRELSAGE